MSASKQKPQKFETRGNSYIGHAIAIKTTGGAEIIILAPTADEAECAAESLGEIAIDPKHIRKAALVSIGMLDKLESK
jgi:hypothetical protein